MLFDAVSFKACVSFKVVEFVSVEFKAVELVSVELVVISTLGWRRITVCWNLLVP